MILSDYTALVQNEVDDTSTRAKNVIERAIKDTYQEILHFTLEDLVGTVEEDVIATADQRYVVPTNTYQDVKGILYKSEDSNYYNSLQSINEQEYYNRYVNFSSSVPARYYLKANNIYFDVAPQDAGTVKIVGTVVQDTLEGAEISLIPDRHTQVVVLGSIARFKSYEGLQDAREYFKLYRGPYFEQGKVGGALKNMIDQINTKQKPFRIKLR